MNIQESNNITVAGNAIKVEKFEESSSANKASIRNISKESSSEENFSIKDCSFVKHKTVNFKTEEDNIFQELTESKLNDREIKDEYFGESISHEDIVIKTEDQEEDQSNSKYFDPDYEECRKTFTCSSCCTALSTEKYKIAHERRCKLRAKNHLGGNVFECSYCKLLHTREEDKNKHQFVCKKRKESKKCGASTMKNDERKYSCDKCSFGTKQKRYLIRHIRIHDKVNVPKYSCNQCSYQTINKWDVDKHLRTHNDFGLICNLCQKSFNEKRNLDAHYVSRHPNRSEQWGRTITNQIIKCPKCLYKTVLLSSLKTHLAIHRATSDQSQFKCNICGWKCIQKSHFTTHLRLHVGQLPFVCTECDKRFNRKDQLDAHLISRHSENEELISSVTSKVHQCDKCNYKTIKNTHFKRHLKTCI